MSIMSENSGRRAPGQVGGVAGGRERYLQVRLLEREPAQVSAVLPRIALTREEAKTFVPSKLSFGMRFVNYHPINQFDATHQISTASLSIGWRLL